MISQNTPLQVSRPPRVMMNAGMLWLTMMWPMPRQTSSATASATSIANGAGTW
jgi:hypothetical protein